MIALAALAAVLLGAAWLGVVAIVCLFRPERAREGLGQMGANWRMQLGEHIPRAIFGGAMVLRAPLSKAPWVFEAAGWFILASSVVILLLPMRWHHTYAMWWAQRIPLGAYRMLALPTVGLGALLAYAAL